MKLHDELARLKVSLGVGIEDPGEEALAEREWDEARRVFHEADRKITAMELSLMEELLVLRITMHRLERTLGRDSLFPRRGEGSGEPGPVHPAVEALAKARERYRRAMKEVEEVFDAAEEHSAGGLGMSVKPLLDRAKGLLEGGANDEKSGAREKVTGSRRRRR